MVADRKRLRYAFDFWACSLAGMCIGAAACLAVQYGNPLPGSLWKIAVMVEAAWIALCLAVSFGLSRSIRSARESKSANPSALAFFSRFPMILLAVGVLASLGILSAFTIHLASGHMGPEFLWLGVLLPCACGGVFLCGMWSGKRVLGNLWVARLERRPVGGLRTSILLWTIALLVTCCCLVLLAFHLDTGLAPAGSAPSVPAESGQVLAWLLVISAMTGWFTGGELRQEPLALIRKLRLFDDPEQKLPRLEVSANSELGRMAQAYNRLADMLESDRQRLKEYAEKVARAERTRKRFLASVSHEIRTPLNGIIGYADLLAGGFDGKLPPSANEAVSVIEREGERLLRLINDILLLAKLDLGRLQIQPEPTSLAAFFALLSSELSQERQVPGFEIVPPEQDGEIEIASQQAIEAVKRLVRVLAAEARGPIRIEYDSSRGRVLVRAEGFRPPPAEEREELFTPFSQPGKARAEGMSGLELPLARLLVERSGGSLEILDEGQMQGFALSIQGRAPAPKRDGGGSE